MRKVVLVLALIACDCWRDVLVHGDPIRKPEAAARSDDYEYQELRGEFADFDTEAPGELLEDRERSSEPIGKWRNNGEALEPKWRDGDSVPLLPFSQFQSYSRNEEIADAEEDGFPDPTGRRLFKHRYAMLNQSNRPRIGSSDRQLPTNGYEVAYDGRDDIDEDYPRARRRPLKNPHDSTGETIVSAASIDGKRGRNLVGDSLNDQEVTSRYREAFQAREYEHEFSDEEYSKPRPRKRRPPQNYEFALANDAPSISDDESRNSSGVLSRMRDPDDEHRSTPSNDDRENTLELKMLLKMQQEEGSSLSEILQRRNLTLADLLKGKADVINALKSRNADESYEYIEEMSRAMSDSLMKLATTATPTKSTTQTSMTFESTTIKLASASRILDNLSTVNPNKVSKSYEQISSNEMSNDKEESEEKNPIEKISTQSAQDSSLLKATTPTIVHDTTTSTVPPIVKSMGSDDRSAGLTTSSNRAIKLRTFDEEEIMEFSDFSDFKKSKNSEGGPVWVGPPSEVAPSQPPHRDTESTLSIEQILNPTERIELVKDHKSENNEDNNNNNKKVTFIQDESQLVRVGESSSAEEYDAFIETEYQNDTPISEDDNKQDELNDDAVLPVEETKQTANPIDGKKEYDDYSTVYDQTSQSVEEKMDRDHASENHQGDTGSRRYEEVVSEIEPEARAEIFELFASGSAGKRLERLLKSRNMSVEELIALRQRGSSKVHLTEVSRLRVPKSKSPQTLEFSSTNNGEVSVTLSPDSNSDRDKTEREDTKQELDRTMNRFAQNIVSYLHDSLFDKDAENGSMSRLLDLVERDRNASKESTFISETDAANERGENPRRTMQIVDLLTTFGSLPFAKDVQRQFEPEIDDEQRAKGSLYNVSVAMIDREKTVRSNNSSSEFHQVGSVEEIVREEPNTIDIRTIYDETISSKNDGEKTLPRGLKPSIIASGAILGLTLVVFLAIFIVCRIKQKQKYTYRNTLSRAVFQGPVMAARKLSNSSSLSTVMVNVVATSTTKRPDRTEMQEANSAEEFDSKSDMDNDSLDANDSWETIPDYAK
ncbi:uncharacterized protein LOC109863708 isoform X2 [Pseudomyrmex gracilis]|uniref:uncharacterized protein LOC109863708 isoform X2 n=1 Tax=Pseudomyrmex gracilis TaxID=219809 RepID=UPI000994A979|nr:uncharacterized protein LOC109863708 isoform X2 [Pseudomyrmex gracilis]